MESQDVISIDREAQPDPWPRILRWMALLALLFAVAQIYMDAQTVRASWVLRSMNYPLGLKWQISRGLRGALAVIDIVALVVMIFGALLLLKRPTSILPVTLGAKMWLVIWVLGMLVTVSTQGFFVVTYLVQNAVWIGFPAAIVVLMREYAKVMPTPAAAPLNA